MIRHFKIKTPLPQLFQIKNDADDFAIPRWGGQSDFRRHELHFLKLDSLIF